MNIFNDDSNFVYLLNQMGQKVNINGIEVQALISNQKDKTIDYKKIKTIVEFKTGDYVQFQDHNWIIVSEVSKTNTIYKAFMRKCTNTLKYKAVVDGVNTIIEIPTFIDVGTATIDSNEYFNLADNEIVCNVGYSMINKVKYITEYGSPTRFILNGRAFKTVYVNNITSVVTGEQGIIIIKLESDTIKSEDTDDIAYNPPNAVIITPPVIISSYQIVTSTVTTSNYDYILNSGLRTQKIYNVDMTPITDGTAFIFSLEQSDLNPTVSPTQLVTLMDNITATTVRLTASSTYKGYFYLVATKGDVITKRLLRIKGQYDN